MAAKTDPPKGVHAIRTPTIFPDVPTVNSYLIENPLTLVDGGLNTADAWKALQGQVHALGYKPEQIRRVLISHGHPDHFGLAEKVRTLAGAEVFVGEIESDKLTQNMQERAQQSGSLYMEYLRRLGIGDETLTVMRMMGEMNQSIAPTVKKVSTLKEGDRIAFDNFELDVLHTPGHTRGIICYYEPERKFLFSSDHLLQETSPNPVIELGPEGEADYTNKFKSLITYYRQIRRVGDMELSCVLPGHGLPFHGHEEVIDSLLLFYQRRQLKIWNVMRDLGPSTVIQIGVKMFPKAIGIAGFLVASELLGNLEVMESVDAVSCEFDGKHYLYRPTGDQPPNFAAALPA